MATSPTATAAANVRKAELRLERAGIRYSAGIARRDRAYAINGVRGSALDIYDHVVAGERKSIDAAYKLLTAARLAVNGLGV